VHGVLSLFARVQIVCFAKACARVAAHTEDDLQPRCRVDGDGVVHLKILLIYASFISFLLIIALPLLGGPFQRIAGCDGRRAHPTDRKARKAQHLLNEHLRDHDACLIF